eukprot:CAMPEP_0173390158 /NCGR_PEP_ID=MMETSP1356-20130122/14327_1 /TAXON_ID=77927 ORGANISM="Hemiselmis virescens, Strain PCC157" /NCGR_SAMPLE_ID=MMETSP1356 /ASSEMBLY_ACC=CAM_ASM_000847 /LENGTH=329 /DNA_ID=CAMNT_0014347487 /DNA_START=11 /DNA_END=1000 /DNA_ORIENTATION=-
MATNSAKLALGSALLAACAFEASAFTAPMALRHAAGRPAALAVRRRAPAAASLLKMQEDGKDKAEEKVSVTADDEGNYFGVDNEGNKVLLTLEAKEKTYLDCCNSFYNDKKQMMSDSDFDQLKEDLAFSGSDLPLMNRMEVMFMVAANRYAEGNPIMSDDEFDNIRRKLKDRNSVAVVHKVPTCRVETNTCKADLTTDTLKDAILYLPIVGIVTLIVAEASYLTIGSVGGPLGSLLLDSPVIALISYFIRNFILFQDPLITRTSCPQCYTEQNIYFGDILFCSGNKQDLIKTQCANQACGCDLRASRSKMTVESDLGSQEAPQAPAVVV